MTNAAGTPIMVSPQASAPLARVHDWNERRLQELIFDHPTCLPLDQIEPGIGQLVSVCMELPLGIGSADNLFVTPEGNLVLAEVKLWGNPEARRKVVAQALEYATALFKLDYTGLETAVMKGAFNGASHPKSLYSLVDGADSPTESVFADRVTRNLREGRIVVLIVGDEIRPATDELVTGLQAHANFHFTFALVEMPVYSRPGSLDEFVVVPRTLIKTETVPRFTIRTEGGATDVIDLGTDELEAAKPSRRSNISSEDFFEAMVERSQEIPAKLKRFLDEAADIDVRPEYLGMLNLKWDQPEGNPVNLGCISPVSGEIRTHASYWWVARDLADEYNNRLAELFGGKIRNGRTKKDGTPQRWVTRGDGAPFRIEDILDHLSDWITAIETFQDAVRERRQDADR
ncbi:MAG: hypothetical protein F4029_11990 [Gammaproteobacteria bacterium]|nr:hypothetical protein [Gammaproteobacteria bacterium]MYK46934.1 hypothetical protein [Gammaproteobacteria bacterium]